MGCTSAKPVVPAGDSDPRPEDDFILDKELGKGAFGVVRLGINKADGAKYALKIMKRAKSRPEFLKNELEVLRLVGDHSNIVGFHGAYELPDDITIVMELMQGGELFERLIESGPYSEHDACVALRKVASALQYMHSKNVLHRDLKPENLLLTDTSDEADIKLADFGLSEVMSGAPLTRVCGTWAYSAPEMAARVGYGLKFDTWSFGVIMFILLSGFHPFDPEGDYPPEQVKALARQGLYNLKDPVWDDISEEAKDLVQRLIVVDPEARYSAQEILDHRWFSHELELRQDPIHPEIGKKLAEFRAAMRRKLAGAIKASVAVQSMRRLSRTSNHSSNHSRKSEEGAAAESQVDDIPGVQQVSVEGEAAAE
mmetsp:Transcript_146266/g.354981  ORF Transcript_146266/g.354981 Transcript_146266/m.354981 type:complete len:369 (+) Transcript_146266:87-1193(+)